MKELGIDKSSIGRVCQGKRKRLVVLSGVIRKYKCDLTVDPFSQATDGKVRIVINAFFDAKVLREGAIAVGTVAK